MIALLSTLREEIARAIREVADVSEIPFEFPPDPALGDLATPVAFSLARVLRRAPRQIATELAERIGALPGVAGVEVAGPGYVNVRVDRTTAVRRLLGPDEPPPARPGKVVVEHTNINPNKAAHIGHLRNAILGDTLVRCLAATGHAVEVQNYIDDTGVQVADVVVALTRLAGLDAAGVRELIDRGEERAARGGGGVDHDLWDLYARVTAWYAEDESRLAHRTATLHALEKGEGPLAEIGALVAGAVVRCHLRTMHRLGVRYDVLPRESDILAHRFWDQAFRLLRESGAIRFAREGKAAGCWVMDLPHDEDDEDGERYEKIIVRSNGTVTYVGKDIAYQMWKFGLLGRDFDYAPFPLWAYPDGTRPWQTVPPGEGRADHPEFGHASRVYNVIDVRQSYLQRVVVQGLERLGHVEQARESIHFSYEMVALSPRTALALQPDLQLSDEELARPWLDMSGRRGLGVKADDLLDMLERKALEEVRERAPEAPGEEAERIAREIAIGALRYYMLRHTRNKVVAFDVDQALAFEGETGPYCQYAAVRISRILDKLEEREGIGREAALAMAREADFEALPEEGRLDHWALVLEAARLPEVVPAAIEALEFATLAKYAFELARSINAFYHRYPVLREPDGAARAARLAVLLVADRSLREALALMGVPIPARM